MQYLLFIAQERSCMLTSITKENVEQVVNKSTVPVVIDVFATWCGPCQQMKPAIHELADEYASQYKFVTLNVDEDRDLAVHYGVSSVPTFLFIKNGTIQARTTGYMSKEDLLEKIQAAFK